MSTDKVQPDAADGSDVHPRLVLATANVIFAHVQSVPTGRLAGGCPETGFPWPFAFRLVDQHETWAACGPHRISKVRAMRARRMAVRRAVAAQCV